MNQLNYKFGPGDEDDLDDTEDPFYEGDNDVPDDEPFVEEDEFPCCPPDEDPGNYGLDGF